ncbi:right-handed parallel beta-helix repeat-containing protein, partial [Vibrio sp.]|nr:right-handed parallel beta-helix repeat-containing protein [Vibrio sp.]
EIMDFIMKIQLTTIAALVSTVISHSALANESKWDASGNLKDKASCDIVFPNSQYPDFYQLFKNPDNLKANQTICVEDGEYNDFRLVNMKVAEKGGNVQFISMNKHGATLSRNNVHSAYGARIQGSSGIELHGFNVQEALVGIEVVDSKDIVLADNKVHNTGFAGIKVAPVAMDASGHPMAEEYAEDNNFVIRNNEVYDAGQINDHRSEGIYIGEGSYSTVNGETVLDIQSTLRNVTIEGNELHDLTTEAVDIKGQAYDVNIVGNTIYNIELPFNAVITVVDDGAVDSAKGNYLIKDNHIENFYNRSENGSVWTSKAISVGRGNATIEGNTIHNPAYLNATSSIDQAAIYIENNFNAQDCYGSNCDDLKTVNINTSNNEFRIGQDFDTADIQTTLYYTAHDLDHSTVIINEITTTSPDTDEGNGSNNNNNGHTAECGKDGMLCGSDENDSIDGNDDHNMIYGYAGDDYLYGGRGNDTLLGGEGFDYLYGEDGNDYLDGEQGQAKLYGGNGNDTLRSSESGWTYMKGQNGNDTYIIPENYYYHGSQIRNDSASSDTDIVVFEGVNSVNDLYFERNGDHLMITPNGKSVGIQVDYWFSDESKKVELVQTATDTITKDDIDYIVSGKPVDTTCDGINHLCGSQYDDEITGTSKNEIIDGFNGDDRLDGGAGNDVIYGGEGNDYILGRDGDDQLDGQAGNANLYGGNGDDSLRAGNSGFSYMKGDAGNDTYIIPKDYHGGEIVNSGNSSSHVDTIVFEGVNSVNDLELTRDGNNLRISTPYKNSSIKIRDWFNGDKNIQIDIIKTNKDSMTNDDINRLF